MDDTTLQVIKIGVPVIVSGFGAVVAWGLNMHGKVTELSSKCQDLEKKVDQSMEKLEQNTEYDKRLAVIESVVMALKDLPTLVAKIDALLEASARRIEFLEDHILNKK